MGKQNPRVKKVYFAQRHVSQKARLHDGKIESGPVEKVRTA